MRPYLFIILVLAGIQAVHILDFMIMMPLGPRLMELLGITPAEFSLLISAYTLSAGIVGFLSAFFIDRFDRKPALLILFAGFGLGTLWCGLAGSYGSLLAARAVAGAFGGTCGSLILAIVGDVVPSDRRATAMGMMGAAFSVASVIGVPFALFLSQDYGWQSPFLFLATLSVPLLGLIAWQVPSLKAHIASKNVVKLGPVDLIKSTLADSGQRDGILLMSLSVMAHFTIIPMMAPFLQSNAGLTQDGLKWVYALGGAATIVTNPLIGRLADRFGKEQIYLLVAPIAAVVILILTHLSVVPAYAILAVTVSLFVFSSARFVPVQAMISVRVDPKRRGSVMAFVSCAQQVSSGLAAYLAGIIVYENGGHIYRYDLVGYIAVAFTIAAALLVWKMMQRPVTSQSREVSAQLGSMPDGTLATEEKVAAL